MTEQRRRILTAEWGPAQDFSSEDPQQIYWSTGQVATIEEYRMHQVGTHVVLDELPFRIVMHMLPSLKAVVSFSPAERAWMLEVPGGICIQLDTKDPDASDDELQVEIYTLTTVYEATIVRSHL